MQNSSMSLTKIDGIQKVGPTARFSIVRRDALGYEVAKPFIGLSIDGSEPLNFDELAETAELFRENFKDELG